MTDLSAAVEKEFARLIARAFGASKDLGDEVEEALAEGMKQPVSVERAESLLTRIIEKLQARSVAGLPGRAELDELVKELVEVRARVQHSDAAPRVTQQLELIEYNNIKPRAVLPKPVFHGREVALREGYVRTRDIHLWHANERIEIHLQQFLKKFGRRPQSEELLNIMLSELPLEGVTKTDQFKIPTLARSVAANGVRKPPIIGLDGTLLDGNRRLAACYYILLNPEFSTEEKRRVEHILVWQLTEHATQADIDAIIVSLNFESDQKEDWPEYIKARKVYQEWEAALALRPHANQREQAQIKREISKSFALGPDAAVVNRYIKMVTTAQEFEDYHVVDKRRDAFEVKHKAAEYFQYFDELSKGTTPGGVQYELNRNPEVKNLVSELLYADKFRNWNQIRDLRYIVDNDEARDLLRKAADVEVKSDVDLDDAQDKVQNALSLGRTRRAEQRMVGANTRIESFVQWLLQLPVSAFASDISADNLQRLHGALKLVDGIVREQLGRR
jgi:hypothetical protein